MEVRLSVVQQLDDGAQSSVASTMSSTQMPQRHNLCWHNNPADFVLTPWRVVQLWLAL